VILCTPLLYALGRKDTPHTSYILVAQRSAAPARAGAVRRVPGPVAPPACADALAPRRLRVPDHTPSQCREGMVRNTTALLHE